MAYRIGCELPDLVAAIAPVAGSMMNKRMEVSCPVSVVAFHGTNDKIVPYEGGEGSVFGYKLHSPPVKDAIEFWARADHCSSIPTREEHGDVVKETYSNGALGTEVCLYTIKKAPHAWPGGQAAWPPWCKPAKELSATDAMCEFFWQHPKQHAS